jgi:hypothetical protein
MANMRVESGDDSGRYKVLLDGEDVSDYCYMADDQTGEVGLWRRNDAGAFYMDPATNEPAQEVRQGQVVIYPMHESVFPV